MLVISNFVCERQAAEDEQRTGHLGRECERIGGDCALQAALLRAAPGREVIITIANAAQFSDEGPLPTWIECMRAAKVRAKLQCYKYVPNYNANAHAQHAYLDRVHACCQGTCQSTCTPCLLGLSACVLPRYVPRYMHNMPT
jgi:hypothetical protein